MPSFLQPMGVFNFVTGFATGIYAGLYLAKHYDVPSVPDPAELFEKLKSLAEQYRKDK